MTHSLQEKLTKPINRYRADFETAWDEGDYQQALLKLTQISTLVQAMLAITSMVKEDL